MSVKMPVFKHVLVQLLALNSMLTKRHLQKLFQRLLQPQGYLNGVWFHLVLLGTVLSLLLNSLFETVFIL